MSWSVARLSALCDEAAKLGMREEAEVLIDNLYRIVDGFEVQNLDEVVARVRTKSQRRVEFVPQPKRSPIWLDTPSGFRALVTSDELI